MSADDGWLSDYDASCVNAMQIGVGVMSLDCFCEIDTRDIVFSADDGSV